MVRLPEKKKSKPHVLANTLLLNVGGAGILVVGLLLAVRSQMTPPPETPLCEIRYPGGVLFSYKRKEGSALSPEDLQARLSGTDRGLLANARIVTDDGVPQGFAMEIALKRSTPDEDDQARSGIGYTWTPRQLAAASSACLSYSVWLPENFNFGSGGALPGIVSNPDRVDYGLTMEDLPLPPPQAENSEGQGERGVSKFLPFSARMIWRSNGLLELLQMPNDGHRGTVGLAPQKATLKPGKWTRIEFEVVLNEPGKPNGTVRAWVDGKIVDERFDVMWRRDEMQSLQSVVGGVHNIGSSGWAPSPVNTKLRISPIELRVR